MNESKSGYVTPAKRRGGAACGMHKVFERDRFARTPRAEVWCQQPKGHDGAHEATLARVSYCWGTPAPWLRPMPSGHVHLVDHNAPNLVIFACGKESRRASLTDDYPPGARRCARCQEVADDRI